MTAKRHCDICDKVISKAESRTVAIEMADGDVVDSWELCPGCLAKIRALLQGARP